MKMKMNRMCIALLIFTMLLSLSVLPVFAAPGDQDIELLGASMRITGEQGLRFVGRIAKSGSITLTEGENANFGILLIPQSALAANATITKDTPNVLRVPAKNLMGQAAVEAVGLTYDGDYTYFSAVQIGIPVEFYGTEWVARAYVIDGSSDYHYSEQMKRSIKGVAESIVADGSAPADQKTAANTVINDYNANDGAVPVDLSSLWDFHQNFGSSALQNTYHCLKVNKKLNVAYLGGSVTVGVGIGSDNGVSMQTRRDTLSWRGLTTTWLKEQFPNAQIRETNAGIGGTGSIFGAYRATDDLHLQNDSAKPDLLFVDAAINDMYDSTTAADVKKYMETIVRTTNQYAPYCDIIFVYVTDSTRLAYTDSSHYPSLAAQHEVAQKYGIPEIYVGKQTCEKYSITSSSAWTNSGLFYDIVHPVVAGYAEYGAFVTQALQAELVDKTLNPYLYTAKVLPSASYNPLVAPARYFFNGANGKTTGFTLTENSSSLDNVGYLTASASGAKVKFTFKGTGLQLWASAKTEASTIRVTIDEISETYTIQRGGADNDKVFLLASGLANTEHTVTIESVSVPATQGKELVVKALMVEGDTDYTGVTFLPVN